MLQSQPTTGRRIVTGARVVLMLALILGVQCAIERSVDFTLFLCAAFSGVWLLNLLARRLGAGINALALSAIVVTALCTIGHFAVVSAENHAHRSVRDLVSGFAPTYATEMERLGHERLGPKTAADDPLYLEMIAAEKRWLSANPAIADVYTFKRLGDGKICLMVDSETDYDRNGVFEGEREERTAIGEVYEEDAEALARAFAGEAMFQDELVTDRWGVWVSAYVPLRDQHGNVDAVLGVDFDAHTFQSAIAAARWRTLGYLSLLVAIALFAGGFLQALEARVQVRNRELELARAAARNELALERTSRMAKVGWWELDVRRGKLAWSSEVRRIHEVAEDFEPHVETAIGFYVPEDQAKIRAAVQEGLETGKPWDLELELVTAKGRRIWVQAQGEPELRAGRVARLFGAFQDIDKRKKAEQELREAATVDRLTGLPNRALLMDRITQRLMLNARDPKAMFALLFLDFDRFKIVNDSLGHEAGDELLRQIAARLRNALRTSDSIGRVASENFPGRLGGDEFVVLLGKVRDAASAALVADRLLQELALPYEIDGHEVVSTASIGLVISEGGGQSAADLLRDADTAMYEAKSNGRACYVIFDATMRSRVQERMQIESDLRGALRDGQLAVVYQPIVETSTGRWVGAEALLRWNHPTRGSVSPSVFIPVAEESSLIVEIGEWVLSTSCAQLADWHARLGATAPRWISVNLSRAQLILPNLAERIDHLIRAAGVQPNQVRLEITENQVMDTRVDTHEVLRAVKATGVSIAMDDFGTGLSSLSGLHQLPIDVLKIDQSFVASFGAGRPVLALASAIIDLARNLHMVTVAEGIETPEQLAVLQSLGCELGQGYLYSRPLPPEEFEIKLLGLPARQRFAA